MRDLRADLATCGEATPWEWVRELEQDGEFTGPGDNPPGYAGDMCETNSVVHFRACDGLMTPIAEFLNSKDARFAITAREGWDIAIRRALVAEEACEMVLKMLDRRSAKLRPEERRVLGKVCEVLQGR